MKTIFNRIFSKTQSKEIEHYSFDINQDDNSKIDFPTQSTLILGNAGCGKTTLLEHFLLQAIKKQVPGLIYIHDESYSCNNRLHEYYLNQNFSESNTSLNFKYIDFQYLSKSQRVNLLSKKYINKNQAFLIIDGITQSIMFNNSYYLQIIKDKNLSFLTNYTIRWISCVMLRLYNEGSINRYDTLPHAISICLHQDPNIVLKWLNEDSQVKRILSPITHAISSNSKLLEEIISLGKELLTDMNNPNIFYILSGDTMSLDLTNPDNPTLLVINNALRRHNGASSAAASIISIIMQQMNVGKRKESIFAIDEAQSIIIPELSHFISTIRCNGIAAFFVAQNWFHFENYPLGEIIYPSISNRFLGNAFPNSKNIKQMCDYLNISPEDLLKLRVGEFYYSVPSWSQERKSGLIKTVKPKLKQDLDNSMKNEEIEKSNLMQNEAQANFDTIHSEIREFFKAYEASNI